MTEGRNVSPRLEVLLDHPEGITIPDILDRLGQELFTYARTECRRKLFATFREAEKRGQIVGTKTEKNIVWKCFE